VSDRHARFEALLPPGVRSRFRSVALARAGPPSRCSRGLLPLQSSLHHGSGSGFSQLHTQQGEALYHVRFREASRLATLLRDPASDAQVHEPEIRRRAEVDRTPHATVRQQPCSTCVSRTPVTPVASLTCTLPHTRRRFARAPFRRHSAPPAPFTPPYPRRRCVTLDLGDALLNRRPAFAPHGADGCLTPREVNQIPRCRVDHDPRTGRGP
jgi:hypothetical protein